jgi:dolichol-phosphate mannosyltransferase
MVEPTLNTKVTDPILTTARPVLPAGSRWVARSVSTSGRRRLDGLRRVKYGLDARFGIASRLVQFCMVGASGMVVDLSLYALLQWLFARAWINSASAGLASSAAAAASESSRLAVAAGISIFVALIWNFTLNRRLTFNDARHGNLLRQFLTYALGNALGIGLSFTLRLWLPARVAFFDRHRLAAAVVGIVAATGISFSMSRWLVFVRQREPLLRVETAEGLVDMPLPDSSSLS